MNIYWVGVAPTGGTGHTMNDADAIRKSREGFWQMDTEARPVFVKRCLEDALRQCLKDGPKKADRNSLWASVRDQRLAPLAVPMSWSMSRRQHENTLTPFCLRSTKPGAVARGIVRKNLGRRPPMRGLSCVGLTQASALCTPDARTGICRPVRKRWSIARCKTPCRLAPGMGKKGGRIF